MIRIMKGLALHLRRSLGAAPDELVEHRIAPEKGHGARGGSIIQFFLKQNGKFLEVDTC